MPAAEAQIPTNRASRYLVQFCQHLAQMNRIRHRIPDRHGDGPSPPTVQHVDWSDTVGTVAFDAGRCTLRADPDSLRLRVEADTEDRLRRLQDGVTRRLETIGRRDHLTVHWGRTDSSPDITSGGTPPPTGNATRQRRSLSTTGWVAAAGLAGVVHLGLAGSALAATGWAIWGANAILAVVVVKVLVVGVHVIGRRLLRGPGAHLWHHRRRRMRQGSGLTHRGSPVDTPPGGSW